MKRNLQLLLVALLFIFVIGTFSQAYGQAENEYHCKVAAELYSGQLKAGEPAPPVFPKMWMINYPLNVYFATDADKLLNRDFNFEKLDKLGSYRIEKKTRDSIMFMFSDDQENNGTGWHYAFTGHLRLGRQLDRIDNFIYHGDDQMYPFTVNLLMNPTAIFAFRPDSTSKEAIFLFFSYTPHDNFPKALLQQFSSDDEFAKLGYDPFSMRFPEPKKNPEIFFKAEAIYPEHLLRMKRSDNVKIMVLVDRDGTVVRSEIIEKARYTPFDEAATDAALKSFFKPGLDANGNPVPAWAPFNVVFDADSYSQK